MARTPKETTPTSLWSVIESMQRRLEAEGLDRDVVNVAVTRGLEALLEIEPPRRAAPVASRRAGRSAPVAAPAPGRGARSPRLPTPRIPTWFRRIAVAKA